MHATETSSRIEFTKIRVDEGEELSSVGYFTSDSEQDIDADEYPDGDFDFDTETDAEEYFDSFLQTTDTDGGEEYDEKSDTNTTDKNDKKLVFKG